MSEETPHPDVEGTAGLPPTSTPAQPELPAVIEPLEITVVRNKKVRWLRVRLAPFEAAIAAIVVVQAVVVFGGWGIGGLVDPLGQLLPEWLAMVWNTSYLVAGLAILGGLLWPRGDVEGAGLILLTAVIVARSIMFGQLLGWGVHALTSVAFGVFVAAAALARISLLRGGKRDVGQ